MISAAKAKELLALIQSIIAKIRCDLFIKCANILHIKYYLEKRNAREIANLKGDYFMKINMNESYTVEVSGESKHRVIQKY